MRRKEVLYSITEASEELGVFRHTIADLVRKLGIKTVPIRENPTARGITVADLERIRRAMTPDETPQIVSAS